ncbi:MAG: T9SS C-terminal target domain-containing protein [Calditrichaeota bacterium]|nr:MAG: T9SS C-terminal target domain-containing protein [Calditrichota bacterium]
MLKRQTLMATSVILASAICIQAQTTVTHSNNFEVYNGEFKEFRSVKDISISDDKVYVINSSFYLEGTTTFKHNTDETVGAMLKSNPTAGFSEFVINETTAEFSKTDKKNVNSITSATVGSDEILFLGTTNSQVRKYTGSSWEDEDDSETNLPINFSANAFANFEDLNFTKTLLGLSNATNTSGTPQATLYQATMNVGIADWAKINKKTGVEFKMPVVDILVSDYSEYGTKVFVAVNDGKGDNGADVDISPTDTTQVNQNGIWVSDDLSAGFTKLELLDGSSSPIKEQYFITSLGYAAPDKHSDNASAWFDTEIIFGVYNIPDGIGDNEPTLPYVTQEDDGIVDQYGCGILAQKIDATDGTALGDWNQYNLSHENGTSSGDFVSQTEAANFLTDMEFIYEFDSQTAGMPAIYVSDYGNGLYRLSDLSYNNLYGASSTAQIGSYTWDGSTGGQKEHLTNLEENRDFGAFTLQSELYEDTNENKLQDIYLGGFRSCQRMLSPKSNDKEWTALKGYVEPQHGIEYVNTSVITSTQNSTEPTPRGIVATNGSVYINMTNDSDLDETTKWEFYFSPGGAITSFASDRFGDLEVYSNGLEPNTDANVTDGMVVGCNHEDFVKVVSSAVVSDPRNTIYNVKEGYSINWDNLPATFSSGDSYGERTNYYNRKRLVNDLALIGGNNPIVIGAIGDCPGGANKDCDESITATTNGDNLRFIIAGTPDNLQGIHKYVSESYDGVPTSSDVNVTKLGLWSDLLKTSSTQTFGTDEFFDDGYHAIYGISDNGTKVWEVYLNTDESLKKITSKTSITGVTGTFNDISVATTNFISAIPNLDAEDLFYSVMLAGSNGIFISERVNEDDVTNPSFSSVLNTTFENISPIANLGSNSSYLTFSERPMRSVNENEVLCVYSNSGESWNNIIYTNNLIEGDFGNCNTIPSNITFEREDIDWIKVTDFDSHTLPYPKSLWYSNDSERGVQATDANGNPICTSLFGTSFGNYEDRLFAVCNKRVDENLWVSKTDNIFKISDTEISDLLTNNSTINLRGSFWVEPVSDVQINTGKTLDLAPNQTAYGSIAGLYFFSKDSPTHKIDLNGGTLKVSDAIISSTRQNSTPRVGDSGTDDDWTGIGISSNNSEIEISGSTIANCEFGVFKNSATVFNDVKLDLNETSIDNVKRYEIYLTNLTTYQKNQIKLYLCEFTGSNFGTNGAGVFLNKVNFTGLEKDYSVSIDTCSFLGNRNYGVYVSNASDIEINRNILEGIIDYDAISISDVSNSTARIHRNKISGVLSGSLKPINGIYCSDSRTDIWNNKIEDTKYGIYLTNSTESHIEENNLIANTANSIAGIGINGADNFVSGAGIKVWTNRDIKGYPKAIWASSNETGLNLDVGKEDDFDKANKIHRNSYAFFFELNSSGFTSKIRRNTAFEQQNKFIYVSSNNSSTTIDAGLEEDNGENSFDPLNSSTPPISFDTSVRVENLSTSTTVHAVGNYWGIPEEELNTNGSAYFDGTINWSPALFAKPTQLPKVTTEIIPESFSLKQNYPNPFNPSTTIEYWIPNQGEGFVTLKIYNVLGQEVKTLVNEVRQTGIHKILWNGTDENGKSVASGVYFYRINAGDFVSSKKLLLLK